MLAQDLMSQPVATCGVDDNLDHAASLMWNSDCGAVPVVDGAGRAVAMLTDRDICMAAYTQGKPLREISVRSAMSQGLQTCFADTPLESVEQMMAQHQVRRVPVVSAEGRPQGMVSINDIARAACGQHPDVHALSNGCSLTAVARTLGAICAPRRMDPGPRIV